MPIADLLRKCIVIDTRTSEMALGHSRYMSRAEAMVHVISGVVACAFRPGNPSISVISKRFEAYP